MVGRPPVTNTRLGNSLLQKLFWETWVSTPSCRAPTTSQRTIPEVRFGEPVTGLTPEHTCVSTGASRTAEKSGLSVDGGLCRIYRVPETPPSQTSVNSHRYML